MGNVLSELGTTQIQCGCGIGITKRRKGQTAPHFFHDVKRPRLYRLNGNLKRAGGSERKAICRSRTIAAIRLRINFNHEFGNCLLNCIMVCRGTFFTNRAEKSSESKNCANHIASLGMNLTRHEHQNRLKPLIAQNTETNPFFRRIVAAEQRSRIVCVVCRSIGSPLRLPGLVSHE